MSEKLNVKYDTKFILATGRNRKEVSWKNKEVTWAWFLDKIKTTHRTPETYNDYLKSKKDRQDEIKDIGGFVGGRLTGGRRKSGNIYERQLITLDIDYGKLDFWSDFTMLYGNAAALYSTHKHSAETPRFRLLIPLDRPVFSDEYIAISRRIAGNLDIEVFDPTTFQPERLMYWPSTSIDGDYLFKWQDGEVLKADDMLNSYFDWKDSTEWPVSEKVDKLLLRSIAKAGDPLEKHGVIGAFCKSYSIDEAIETFLPEIYGACDTPNRYSYVEGSTAGGLITYEDKYAYSHHGSDPTSGKLCNAFDLVRIHKFGIKDDGCDEDTPSNKKPSYLEMLDFARADKKVKKLLISEKINSAISDFEAVALESDEKDEINEQSRSSGLQTDDSWHEKLNIDRKGNPTSTIYNVTLILENDQYFKGKIAYDEFEKCEIATGNLPWRKINKHTRRLVDTDDANIRLYLEKTYGINNASKIRDGIAISAVKNSIHPVKEYLANTKWDGLKRLDTLLIDYQGVEDNGYTRAVTRKTLVAAVARIFDPGVKFDTVLTLVGGEGLSKSTLIKKLGRQWFSESFSTVEGKQSFEQLQGVWIIEIAELSGLNKADIATIKHFITKTEDRYRVAFGKRTENFPRQCIFFATTNKIDFLKDYTGNRRYWPVHVKQIKPTKNVFEDLNGYEIDQIWAEAVGVYKGGKERLYLSEEMEKKAQKSQKNHFEQHPWADIFMNYLDLKFPSGWASMKKYDRAAFLNDDELQEEGAIYLDRVSIYELWSEALKKRDVLDSRSANTIREIMRNMEGWREENRPVRFGIYGVLRKGYVRSDFLLEDDVTKGVTKGVTNNAFL